ncbi:hypothetical protein GCM10010295_14850 [Streptomyces intermedius]
MTVPVLEVASGAGRAVGGVLSGLPCRFRMASSAGRAGVLPGWLRERCGPFDVAVEDGLKRRPGWILAGLGLSGWGLVGLKFGLRSLSSVGRGFPCTGWR